MPPRKRLSLTCLNNGGKALRGVLCQAEYLISFSCCRWLKEVQGRTFSNYVQWLIMTFAISLVDAPALSLPCGLSSKGLPIGLQIIGGHRQDGAVLALAATYEQSHPWKNLVPK